MWKKKVWPTISTKDPPFKKIIFTYSDSQSICEQTYLEGDDSN